VPHRLKPKPQGQIRVREQRSRSDRGLILAATAVLERPRRYPSIATLTAGTDKSFGPAQLGQILPASRLVAKLIPQFQHRTRIIVHAPIYYHLRALENSAYPHSEIRELKKQMAAVPERWFSENMILAANGAWIVCASKCRKEASRIHNIFSGALLTGNYITPRIISVFASWS